MRVKVPGSTKMQTAVAIACVVVLLSGATAGTTASDDGVSSLTATEWDFPHSSPVQIAALPDGGLLVAALTGQIYHYTESGDRSLVTVIDVHPVVGEFGLLGMTLNPDYPEDPGVYLFRTEDEDPPTQSILRFDWTPGQLATAPVPVVEGLTANPVCCHNGGRVAFGPDGMLYATLGDNMASLLAQNPLVEPGSVLRYTPDGDVPMDNPFWPSPVYVSGLRNPFGITFDDEWGLIVTDNGPSVFDGPPGYDRLYAGLEAGDNGGWPLVYGLEPVYPPVLAEPIWNSQTTATAPSGVTLVRDSAVSAWDDQIVWCNYNQDEARIIDPADPGAGSTVITQAPCQFDVAQDAQGRLVFATGGALWVLS